MPKVQIAEVESSIARGKQLTKLEKEIVDVRSRPENIEGKTKALVEAGFSFGQVIRFVGEIRGVELEIDGVVLSFKDENLTLGCWAFVPGEGSRLGLWRVAIDELQVG
ncbi:hypothetical protein [Okeania sp. SIO2G5]|uniref:hypothetical protein n=1 Tax=Okeania sp. SIO2G5 TaxID=2607796 RepID=UPI0013BFA44F|nr:hypothetical protein [Okeania sp. SIO2G5]NEP76145.1 hypothetical protein [Okeania sp. SIO2G5]